MIISFIGGGNMASALISGMLKSSSPGVQIRVSDPSREARERLEALGVVAFEDGAAAIEGADVVVLAVKPQVMPDVLSALSGGVGPAQLVISVAAGITVEAILRAWGGDLPVIRTMPNTPALLGAGITGLYAAPGCTGAHREIGESLMRTVGETVWVEEETLIDVVTAISGSGPAYFYLMIEALRDAGTAQGLSPEVAGRLAIKTAYGAGLMALNSDVDVAELRRRVTSPGGTTQAALAALEQGDFGALIGTAVTAAVRRGRELSRGGEKA